MNSDRERYQQDMQAQLDRWRDAIDQLEAGVSEIEVEARPAFEHRLERLKRRYSIALHNFEDVLASDDARWGDLTPLVDVAAENVRLIIEEMVEQVR